MKSIIVIIPYFGAWPEWFPLYLASCAANPTVTWQFYTDCPIPTRSPTNVAFTSITLADYARRAARRLGIPFAPATPYKLCDLKPTFGVVHAEDIAGFDYFGFGDIDVIYGDLRRFLTDRVLSRDVVSTQFHVSGHFVLLRNAGHVREAFRRIPGWQALISDPESTRFDEDYFTLAFMPPIARARWWWWLRNHRDRGPHRLRDGALLALRMRPRDWRNHHFEELYTTILTPSTWHDGRPDHPDVWFWRDGKLTNARDGERQFIYLHFMNFVSARHARPGELAAWRGKDRLVHFDPASLANGTLRIDRDGFHLVAI